MAGEQRQAKFVSGNLMRHVTVMALTASVGLMAVFVVDLINLVYISWLGRPELQAAIGYAAAVLFFTTSFGIGLSIAVSALVARAVGARDLVMARRKASNGMYIGILSGVVFAAVVWLFLDAIVGLLGAKGATRDEAVLFLQIIIPSQPLLMVGMVGGAILRSHGDAKRAMMATIWGAVAAAALDPIFIFGFGWELTGAAIVSVISRVVIGVMALVPIIRHYGGFMAPDTAGLIEDLPPVLAIGVPAILTQVATPVGQAYVTAAIAPFGEAAVAAMAIAGRLVPVAFGVIFALSGAVGPIIGQNLGAGHMDRVRQTFRDALVFTAVVIVGVSAVLFGLRGPIADLFHAEGETRELLYLFCGPLSLLWFFNGVIFVANATCNNLGKPFLSTLINWGRNTVGTIPFVMLFAHWWGADGVLIGQAVGGVVFGALGYVVAVRVIAQREAVELARVGNGG